MPVWKPRCKRRQRAEESKVLTKLAAMVTAHPWRVIGGWVVATLIVLALSPQLASFTSSNDSTFLPSSYQSVRAQAVAERYFPSVAGASGTIVVSRARGGILTASDQALVASLADRLAGEHLPSVRSVSTSALYLAPTRTVQIIQVGFTGQIGSTSTNAGVAALRARTDRLLSGTGLVGGLTGNAAISVDSAAEFAHAETIIELATVVLILLLLGLVFQSVAIAVLPLAVIGVIHQIAQALTADLADWFHFQVGTVMAPLLIVVMFGVGTDYFVFLVFRYRERLATGDAAGTGLRFAMVRAGEVVLSAAATVMAAFAALLVASLGELRTLAPGLIAGIFLTLLASLTLVPAVLSLVGPRIFWPTDAARPRTHRTTRSSFISGAVARRPWVVLIISLAILGALASGLLGYTTTYDQLAELPSSTPSLHAYDTIASVFPAGYLGPTQVFVAGTAPLDRAAVAHLGTTLSKCSGVALVEAPDYSADSHAALIQVILKANPYSGSALTAVTGPIDRAAHRAVPGATTLVGGTTSQIADTRTALDHDMRVVFPLALVIVALILGLLLRSVVAPAYVLAGVIVTYVATLGSISLVFITGERFSGLDFVLPVVVYIFVMAVGTDYNILMAARLREEFNAGASPREAARAAVLHGSPAVWAAALILAGTFASLLLTGIQLLEEIGLAVAFGVLLAANLLATRIVPTIAALRGWHFWWPGRMHGHASTGSHPGEGRPGDGRPGEGRPGDGGGHEATDVR